jgi:transcriptional regulator with XRE-family HTH domain
MYALRIIFCIVQFYKVNNVKDIAYMKTFGENLQKIRLSKNMTQEALAYTSDIPISQVGRIERGEINTTISTVKAIANALNVPVKYMFDF